VRGRPWALDYDTGSCSVAAALQVIGEKWAFLVLRDAFSGVRRFEDMRRRTGAPRQVLADRLNRLVGEGLLRRVPYREPGQRARHEYRLTEKGLALYPVLIALMEWGNTYPRAGQQPSVLVTHRDCGAGVHLELRCDAGHRVGSAREVTPLPGPGARKIA
jgi:DNA-binding HxlR family transcriptional regulator